MVMLRGDALRFGAGTQMPTLLAGEMITDPPSEFNTRS